MYLLDTNILSEARRRTPAALSWLASVDAMSTYVSVISLGEIMKGVEIQMSRDPKLSHRLLDWLDRLQEEYGSRVLPISLDVALAWGRIAAGRNRGMPDAVIGATARVHNLTLVTRNTRDFQDLPIKVFDPWQP